MNLISQNIHNFLELFGEPPACQSTPIMSAFTSQGGHMARMCITGNYFRYSYSNAHF